MVQKYPKRLQLGTHGVVKDSTDRTILNEYYRSEADEENLEDTCPKILLTNEENILEQTLG